MGEPVGFLITWTSYGTWLYGDARGSVDRVHNVYGAPVLPTQQRRTLALRRRLRHASVHMDGAARTVVTDAIQDHCRKREWDLIALNVRSNHVHVVVRFAGVGPEVMMGEWKAWSSRRLRERGLIAKGRPVWTRHGSTRYLWKESELESVHRYVMEGQDAPRFEGR